jgi:excisionase family DNA binding protein
MRSEALTLTIPEFSRVGASLPTCRRMVASGEVPNVQIGRRRRIPTSYLKTFVVDETTKATAPSLGLGTPTSDIGEANKLAALVRLVAARSLGSEVSA